MEQNFLIIEFLKANNFYRFEISNKGIIEWKYLHRIEVVI